MAVLLTISPTPGLNVLPAGNKVLTFATRQLSQGRNFVSPSEYAYIQSDNTAGIPADINALTAYVARFGSLIAGKKIFFKLIQQSPQGFRSTPIEVSVIVT